MKIKKILVFIFSLAFLIRFIGLSQSLWLDEATTARVSLQYNYWEIVRTFSPTDFHPPFYYLFMKAWTTLFGYSEVALRMPSVIFSLLTGWMIYKIGSSLQLINRLKYNVGIWAAAFFLFNPLIIYYSQEARMYMMVTFFVTSAFYYLIRSNQYFLGGEHAHNRSAQTSTTVRNIDSSLILGNVFIFLSLGTFYGSVFFIAALYLYLVINRRFRTILLVLPGILAAIIAISPLFVQQFLSSQISTSSVTNWKEVLGPASLKNLVLIPIKFTSGRISFEPKLLYYLISGIWMLLIFYFTIASIAPKKKKRSFEAMLLFLFFIPIGLGFIFSFVTPLLQYFRFLYLIPLLVLSLSFGARKQTQRYILLAGFIIFSSLYLLSFNNYREDWKSLSQSLITKDVYMIVSSSDPLRYYNKDINIHDLKNLRVPKNQYSITVIPYTSEIHGIPYVDSLNNLGFQLQSKTTVRHLSYEVWTRLEH